ncbi:MAG TPA: putative glycoside hydrolase, partial [Gemmatimonadaceae bacterium]|nr:putative glycoside hydrolase [Gemmatimonadaceae bacterium]
MMTPTRIGMIAFLPVLLGCQHQGDASSQPGAVDFATQGAPGSSSTSRAKDSIAPPVITRVPTPDTLRGLYVNRWAALGRKLTDLIGVAKRTEINALVIDVKDDRGFVLYRSKVPLAREIGADTADGHWMASAKLRAVLDTMAAHKIYPIARIVVAKDPLLAAK